MYGPPKTFIATESAYLRRRFQAIVKLDFLFQIENIRFHTLCGHVYEHVTQLLISAILSVHSVVGMLQSHIE